MQEEIMKDITILNIRGMVFSAKMPYLECVSKEGLVAFWGDETNPNIIKIRNTPLPFTAKCKCKIPNNKKYVFWIPYNRPFELIETPKIGTDELRKELVKFRRELGLVLDKIDSRKQGESLFVRIDRCSENKKISKRIANLMKFVSGLSDSAKYDIEEAITQFQYSAGINAWFAIDEYINTQA